MAAYAALLSLMRIIEKLHLHPHPPPISLNKRQIQSLTARITFLQEFLEAYNPHLGYSAEADPLETRIADAAYAAEDVIESSIVDSITNVWPEFICSDDVYEGLKKVIQDMASIQREAKKIRKTLGLQLHHHTNSTPHQESLRSTSTAHNSSMVGVDDVLLQIKDELTSDYRRLQIVPIVGMGGSGKTTLASNIYQDSLIHDHFDVYAWATISQEYSIQGIFSQILHKLQNNEDGQQLSEDDLGHMLHRCLFGRRYLIIMDDMWNIEAWEKVRWFFPDNENGSRIVITTRLSNLASEITASDRFETRLLDEDDSWNLLSKTVFGENCCPLELVEIGQKIAKSCKGLPLSIVVVGGFLAKSKRTREFWEYIEKNLNSIVNSVEDGSCLRILHLSYNQLPLHLKPCFLYVGVFREDEVIHVSKLTKLWVAEGFLKPIKGKSLEETAKEYLKDLTDRNLILIQKKGFSGSIKECKIHDLLREICLREAEKERFYVVARQHGPHQGVTITQRRIVIYNTSKKEDIDALHSMSLARSLIWEPEENPPLLNLRLLRIFESFGNGNVENMYQLVNLRYLGIMDSPADDKSLSISRLWNLETLYVSEPITFLLRAEIWCMPHIRHVINYAYLPDPPCGSKNDIFLGNLHTLHWIEEFKCSEEVVKRIPNVKKLRINYEQFIGWSGLDNLVCLHKLTSLGCSFWKKMPDSGKSLNFPQSLKKLFLRVDHSDCWEDILEKIGSLPLLQKLRLSGGCFEEGKWETVEGQFQSLKYLQVQGCHNLKQWTMESSHFPRLEHLDLGGLTELEEIPLQVAEIPTLGLIELIFCSESATISARRILEEQQESNGEATIQVRVMIAFKNEAVESLASHPNIQVSTLF